MNGDNGAASRRTAKGRRSSRFMSFQQLPKTDRPPFLAVTTGAER